MAEKESEREARQEPYWAWACKTCRRQLIGATSRCCGDFGQTIYLVPEAIQFERGRYRRALEQIAEARSDQHAIGGRLPEQALRLQRIAREALNG
jgi:hypothetical protein